MRANRLKMLDEKLHLTDAQKQQITGIWADAEKQGRALRDEVLVPRVHLVQVSETSGRKRAAQVQGHGRAVIGAQQPANIGGAISGES